MRDNLHDYRKNYNKGELTKSKVDVNPLQQFRKWFYEAKDLEDYINSCVEKKPKGMVTFTRADEVLKQVDNPDWLISSSMSLAVT
mgnify:CR=1 FL=1